MVSSFPVFQVSEIVFFGQPFFAIDYLQRITREQIDNSSNLRFVSLSSHITCCSVKADIVFQSGRCLYKADVLPTKSTLFVPIRRCSFKVGILCTKWLHVHYAYRIVIVRTKF